MKRARILLVSIGFVCILAKGTGGGLAAGMIAALLSNRPFETCMEAYAINCKSPGIYSNLDAGACGQELPMLASCAK